MGARMTLCRNELNGACINRWMNENIYVDLWMNLCITFTKLNRITNKLKDKWIEREMIKNSRLTSEIKLDKIEY